MKKDYKYLFKNIGLLTISQFGTKLLSFLLVPLYTNILNTAEYGTYDMFNTTVNLLIPIVTFNIADSILVFALDKNKSKNNVLSIGIKYAFIGTILVTILSFINKCFDIIKIFNDYWYYMPVLLFLIVMVSVLSCFARGIDRVKETAISGVLCSAVMIGLNILFLLYLRWGLYGYFLASILGYLVQVIYLFISCRCWKYISFKKNKKLEKEMKDYSLPMIANTLGWWINNSSDRYIVIWLCGVAANGIYSVGYKIPQIINMFQNIFNQAWTMSAVKSFDSEDSEEFFSKTYAIYNCGMTIVCAGIIVFTKLLATFLYAKDFYKAWEYVPFLSISIVFGALSGYLGGIFSAVKDSKIFAKSTIVGAVVNIVLNIILVYMIGALGAAIATGISYFIVWVLRLKHANKYIELQIDLKRDIFTYIILIIESVILFIIDNSVWMYLMEIITLIILGVCYKKEINGILDKVIKRG